MAEKNLSTTDNKPVFRVVSHHVWCTTGDACELPQVHQKSGCFAYFHVIGLQEGVGLEAISLAGHWKLDNLTLTYDYNQVTCDGPFSITNTEDVNAKMESCRWRVVDVFSGRYDANTLTRVLEASRKSDMPTFANVRTVIGLGSAVAGNTTAHDAAFGTADVADMKQAYGFKPEAHFFHPRGCPFILLQHTIARREGGR